MVCATEKEGWSVLRNLSMTFNQLVTNRGGASDSAIISQTGEDVLDNVQSGSFCDSEEIRVAFFLATEPL
jgi:hypothetical protein